jgi:CheY-like chemotaxis protein
LTEKSDKKGFIDRHVMNEELPLDLRKLNLVCICGFVATFIATVCRIVMGMPLVTILTMLIMMLSVAALLLFVNRFPKYHKGAITVALFAIANIQFPIIFFTNGGIDGGISSYFSMGLILIFLLTHGTTRIFLIISNLVIIGACYYTTTIMPNPISVVQMETWQRLVDILQSLVVVGFFIGIVTVFLDLMYLKEKDTVEATNKELIRHDRLLEVVNNSALSLLTSKEGAINSTISDAMKDMCESVDADRMSIFEKKELGGKTRYVRLYTWNKEGYEAVLDTYHEEETDAVYPVLETIPEWEETFEKHAWVNAPLSERTDNEKFMLGRYKIKSMLLFPIFIKGEFFGFTMILDCKNSRYFEDSVVNVLFSGSILLSNAITRNKMEAERNEALESAIKASQAKGDFLSNMSHEIRTPMNAIIGMTSVGKATENEERKDYAFNKIEAGKLELSYVSFDFEKMLKRVVNVVMFPVEEKRIKFGVYIDENIPRKLIGDDQHFSQVITNLLSNAVKFTPEQGEIRLGAYLENETEDDIVLRVMVTDTGVGISEEQQSRLFTSFEQAESSISRKYGGTGLGLAISKRIVELMNGEIKVESEIGAGSTFFFTVHLAKDKSNSLMKEASNWKDIRALVVDDDKDLLDYFKDISRRLKINCDTALSAEEAIEMLQDRADYDIYFIDMKMPKMNGLELSKHLRSELHSNSIITIISAYQVSDIQDEAPLYGVDRVISKPIFPSTVSDIISEYFGSSSVEQEENQIDNFHGIFKGHKILLAEDVAINREIVCSLLEETGIEIDSAENGKYAVDMFKENPSAYNLILMDMQMPEMDGLKATQIIRENDKEVPNVAMTANVMTQDIQRCLDAGMNDHIGKPLDIQEVIDKLSRYLR